MPQLMFMHILPHHTRGVTMATRLAGQVAVPATWLGLAVTGWHKTNGRLSKVPGLVIKPVVQQRLLMLHARLWVKVELAE